MILAAHQPDLFPYAGFFFKMWQADVFDLAAHDQFQSRGYQRRVKMRGSWCSVPVLKAPAGTPIRRVLLAPGAGKALRDTIIGRYRDAPYWKERSAEVLSWVEEAPEDKLWTLNTMIITMTAKYLGIGTKLKICAPPQGTQLDGILDVCRQYGATTYISGLGGKAYMGERPRAAMQAHGVDLLWARPTVRTEDSILTNIFCHKDPWTDVRAGLLTKDFEA